MNLVTTSDASARERHLVKRLQKECTEDVLRRVFVPMIDNRSCVSLRAIDWAVVNWSKKHNVMCQSLSGELMNVHQSYKAMLARWKRRYFDPFRRRERVYVSVDGQEHETTLGQLNFAVWLYVSGVYAYVHRHIEDIERDMLEVTQSHKRNKLPRHKRTELTKTPKGVCVAFLAPHRVTFGRRGDH